MGLILGSGRSPGEGNDYPLQYSCLENSMDRGIWRDTVHGVAKESDRNEQLTLSPLDHQGSPQSKCFWKNCLSSMSPFSLGPAATRLFALDSITPLIKINDGLIWLNSIANLPHLTNQQHSIQMITVYIYLVLCSLSLPSLGKLIKSHSFKYYVYLYDSQIFISFAQVSRWHT